VIEWRVDAAENEAAAGWATRPFANPLCGGVGHVGTAGMPARSSTAQASWDPRA
jgi:hypothetical protein